MVNTSKRIIFFGTPKIAAECLRALISINANVVAVVTRADKPVGRSQKIIYSDVKQLAINAKLPIYQPENLNEIYEDLRKLNPDLIFTCAYGKFIPNNILDIPKYKAVNVHPSLLPKYRGASPIQSVLINNETKTGISFMYMVDKLDAGDVIFQQEVSIEDKDNYITLSDKLAAAAANIIKTKFNDMFDPNLKTIKQDDSQATFCKTIKHDDERINWNKSAKEINGLIKGLYDKPATFTTLNNTQIKIYEAEVIEGNNTPGLITKVDKTGIYVGTSNGILVIKSLQLPSKKRMNVSQIINGNHPFQINSKFI